MSKLLSKPISINSLGTKRASQVNQCLAGLAMSELRKSKRKRGTPRTFDVEFLVVWNSARRGFEVESRQSPTKSFVGDRNAAVALAVQRATAAQAQGLTAAVYSYREDGLLRAEWSS
jgi:hypothetical protein